MLHGELDAGELLKIFARSIMEWAKGGENASREDNDNDEGSEEAKDKKTTDTGKANQDTAETLATIVYDRETFLAFLQAVAFKSPRVVAAQISLRADKRARVWFRRWIDVNLPTLPNPYPQYHMDLTGVLTNLAMRLHTAKALRPVVATHREA